MAGTFSQSIPTIDPPSLKTSKKWVSKGGRGLGGSGPNSHWGMRVLDRIMILGFGTGLTN